MFPRRPILLGGVIAPVLWTGLIHSVIEVMNPVLNHRIDWLWFVISQMGFGIVAGIVVSTTTAHAHVAASSLRCPRGHRSARSDGREGRKGSAAMNRRSTFVVFTIRAYWRAPLAASSRGAPRSDSEVVPPSQIWTSASSMDRTVRDAMARREGRSDLALADPVFLAIADDAVIRRTASQRSARDSDAGLRAERGRNAHRQADRVMVQGIRSWAKPDVLRGMSSAAAMLRSRRRSTTRRRCLCDLLLPLSRRDGRGGKKASSIVNGSYLALVSDQQLRTIVIAGRPELGAPDWRDDVRANPCQRRKSTDVVAWLASQRPRFPGQPYPNSLRGQATGGVP